MTTHSSETWIFLEQHGGSPADVGLELLTKGRRLAQAQGGSLVALVLAKDADRLIKAAFDFGADEVLVVTDPALEFFRTAPYARTITKLVQERKPRILLFGATGVGRDLAPRVASATVSGLTADCTELEISDVDYLKKKHEKLLLQIRPAFGGNIIATIISPDTVTQMATVREGVMKMQPVATPKAGRVTEAPFVRDAEDDLVQLIEQHREESKSNLKHAPIVIAGGYGLGSKANFQLVHKLAKVLGGEVAGSRAAVDAGYIEANRQVGQTGITVRPKLYVAIGISGAIQHRAGMQESSRIVAINSNPTAPIFDVAHFAIVGDAVAVIPRLIEAYEQRLK